MTVLLARRRCLAGVDDVLARVVSRDLQLMFDGSLDQSIEQCLDSCWCIGHRYLTLVVK